MGCAGDCCVAFHLADGALDRMRAGTVQDSAKLLAMLVPITVDEAGERRKQFNVALDVHKDGNYHRCVHWDETTRLCGNYEDRPVMCSAFPYGKPCEHGCDCKDTVSP